VETGYNFPFHFRTQIQTTIGKDNSVSKNHSYVVSFHRTLLCLWEERGSSFLPLKIVILFVLVFKGIEIKLCEQK
jgi:hypothetical protein